MTVFCSASYIRRVKAPAKMRSIYFDYNATTPLDPKVRGAMLPFQEEIWGNPSSIHHIGRKARAHLDEFRDRTSAVLGCKPSEIVFTSGGTESANLAVLGTARLLRNKGRHLITSAVEHHAVLHAFRYLSENEGFELSMLPVDSNGRVSVDQFVSTLRPDTILVSVMAANNEIGTIQPVADLGAVCRERGIVFHTDAVQWFGKLDFSGVDQFNADLVSICGHKFHGPKGAGALYIRSPLHPHPIVFGGGHENERRAGTENLAGIAGFVEALERFVPSPVFLQAPITRFVEDLSSVCAGIAGVHLVGSRNQNQNQSLPNTVAFVVENSDSIALLAALDVEGICASSGSACSAGSLEPSHVVAALGLEPSLANSLVRFSLGRETTAAEVEYAASVLPGVVRRAQRLDNPVKKL